MLSEMARYARDTILKVDRHENCAVVINISNGVLELDELFQNRNNFSFIIHDNITQVINKYIYIYSTWSISGKFIRFEKVWTNTVVKIGPPGQTVRGHQYSWWWCSCLHPSFCLSSVHMFTLKKTYYRLRLLELLALTFFVFIDPPVNNQMSIFSCIVYVRPSQKEKLQSPRKQNMCYDGVALCMKIMRSYWLWHGWSSKLLDL